MTSLAKHLLVSRAWTRAARALLGVLVGGAFAAGSGCFAEGAPSTASLRQAFPDQAARVLEGHEAFVARGGGFATRGGADVAAELGRGALSMALPASAGEEIVFHVIGGFEARVREVGASGPGTIVENAVAYPREGGTSYWSAAEQGYEEWVMLAGGRAKGAEAAVAWEVSGATLRQEGDSVALADTGGVVRVRVTAPVAYAAGGRPVTAHLAARGTTIELSVETEEAVLIDPLWKAEAVLNTGRAYHTATLLPSGKVLVAGGLDATGVNVLGSAEIYDPVANLWTPTHTSMITPRFLHTATLLQTGKVLVAGGEGNGQLLTAVELYDPVLDTWTSDNPTNDVFVNHTATLLSSGKVLLVTGSQGRAELYDPTTHAWSDAGMPNVPRFLHTATLLTFDPVLDTVLVAGGLPESGVLDEGLQSAEIWDPASNKWSLVNPMNTARAFHTATLIGRGQVLVAGGAGPAPAGGTMFSQTAEVYDPTSGQWTLTSNSMSVPRDDHTATLLQSGQVLVAGGSNGAALDLSNTDLFDPNSNTWSPGLPMNVARYVHTATALSNGTVLVAGGFTGTALPGEPNGTATSSTELYEPCVCSDGRLCPNGIQAHCCLCSDGTACPNGDSTQCSVTFSCKAPALPCACSGPPENGVCICLSSASKCAQFCGGKGGSGPAGVGRFSTFCDFWCRPIFDLLRLFAPRKVPFQALSRPATSHA